MLQKLEKVNEDNCRKIGGITCRIHLGSLENDGIKNKKEIMSGRDTEMPESLELGN